MTSPTRSVCLALCLIVAGSAVQAQTPPLIGTPPGPGAGNPPSGWSGGATSPQSDTGRTHPDSTGAPAAPSTASVPPPASNIVITSESQARKAIEADGFTRVRDLKREYDGTWVGRATRGTSNVAVRIDQRGNISAE